MKKLAATLLICLLCTVGSAWSQSPTPDECLARVKNMEPMLPKLMDSASAAIHALLPNPTMAKVIATKDKTNLKNYGGLSEGFFFAGDKVKGEKLYNQFKANAKTILGPTDTYQALIEGDMGLVYFYEKNYAKAEPMLLDSKNQLEANLTAAVANNLITDYMCLSMMYDKKGKPAEAKKYAKALVDLAVKQRSKPF